NKANVTLDPVYVKMRWCECSAPIIEGTALRSRNNLLCGNEDGSMVNKANVTLDPVYVKMRWCECSAPIIEGTALRSRNNLLCGNEDGSMVNKANVTLDPVYVKMRWCECSAPIIEGTALRSRNNLLCGNEDGSMGATRKETVCRRILYLPFRCAFPISSELFSPEFVEFVANTGSVSGSLKAYASDIPDWGSEGKGWTIDPYVYLLWKVAQHLNEGARGHLDVVQIHNILVICKDVDSAWCDLAKLVIQSYGMVVVGDVAALEHHACPSWRGLIMPFLAKLEVAGVAVSPPTAVQLITMDKLGLPLEKFPEQLQRTVHTHSGAPHNSVTNAMRVALHTSKGVAARGRCSNEVVFKPRYGSCGSGVCRSNRGKLSGSLLEGVEYMVQPFTLELLTAEHRYWIRMDSADDVQILMHACTSTSGFLEDGTGSLTCWRDDNEIALAADQELRGLLKRIGGFISPPVGTPMRIDLFKSEGKWMVNELDCFGHGELISGLADFGDEKMMLIATLDEIAVGIANAF
ncbi:hypothetical protein CYMTET_53475, partial [Cymbomonas tetramitiformis]